jgi:hypothetical protein
MVSSFANAEAPCDFKGISVGDKLTPVQIMAKLGVSRFKTNPGRPSSDKESARIEKYGITGAAEMQDWEIGPYCDQTTCIVPGVKVGIDIPSSVFVLFDKDTRQVQAINVAVNASHWDNLVSILKRKYGPSWNVEKSDMEITNLQSKRRTLVHRFEMAHREGGVNKGTGDRCELGAVNYDIVFEHADPLGLYHSVFEIKLVSTNF